VSFEEIVEAPVGSIAKLNIPPLFALVSQTLLVILSWFASRVQSPFFSLINVVVEPVQIV
jgi:hypothetical protein